MRKGDYMNIPKKIHYCWFGKNPMPKMVLKCIESWKKYCPDYEIIKWSEDNYDIESSCEFVREAYRQRKWAFVSDYARLDIIWQYGGICLDTDVELIKSLDVLIDSGNGFFGCEQIGSIATGLGFACKKGEPILKEMMDCYQGISFSIKCMEEFACPKINTYVFEKHGFEKQDIVQDIAGIHILPTEYLCPENMWTGEKKYTDNTISIHHYNASWQPADSRFRMKVIISAKKILSYRIVKIIRISIRKLRHLDG